MVVCDRSLGRPAIGLIHLMPFLLPTRFCDSENGAIVELAGQLAPPGTNPEEAAKRVRDWVRKEIVYTLDLKNTTASQTLNKREGMCTNKANLQVAILRAAGVPAGYVMCHVTREVHFTPENVMHLQGIISNVADSLTNARGAWQAFKCEHILDELYETISNPTIHCFCATYIPEHQSFRYYDATERERDTPALNRLLAEDAVTGETTYKPSFLAGPFGPVQANLDHLLAYEFPSRISPRLREKQNALYRQHKEI